MIIRKVEAKDIPSVLELIKGLAEFENDLGAVNNSTEKLHADIFVNKFCDALVAVEQDEVVAFALYYTSYSTWKGPCLYLEDLYVIPTRRKKGIGSKLFDEVVKIAKERKVARMDWQILDWNTSAIDFYKRKNAIIDPEWLNGRLFFPENE